MAMGSGGFLQAKDMMKDMARETSQTRGYDLSTETVMVLGIYALLTVGGRFTQVLGVAIVDIWLVSKVRQDLVFACRHWAGWAALEVAAFDAGLALGALCAWFLLTLLPSPWLAYGGHETLTALLALGPGWIAWGLARRFGPDPFDAPAAAQ